MYHIVLVVYGDDNMVFAPPRTVDFVRLADDMKKLGLEMEIVAHDDPAVAIMDVSFCSQKFWPVEGSYVLGPDLERALSTLGYYVNPPPNMPHERLIRGDMIGRSMAGHVPFYRKAVERMLRLTDGVTAWFDRRDRHSGKVGYERHHTVCDATWSMLFHLYGLREQDEIAYAHDLHTVVSMPAICDSTHIARIWWDYVPPDVHFSFREIPLPAPLVLGKSRKSRMTAMASRDNEWAELWDDIKRTHQPTRSRFRTWVDDRLGMGAVFPSGSRSLRELASKHPDMLRASQDPDLGR